MTHVYLSTYCLHGEHDRCRHTCKLCSAPCVCACHDGDPSLKEEAHEQARRGRDMLVLPWETEP